MLNGQKRVLVIGLDGATFDLIDPWIAAGHLPNLKRLVESGSRGLLSSTIQPTTAPAWVTFMTGLNQGKHGLYDFVRRQQDGYNLEVTNATHVAAPTMFDIAGENGRKVISLNIPYTFPPRPVNGIMIGGPFTPTISRDLVYPPAFFDTFKKLVPDYFVIPDFDHRAPNPMIDFSTKLFHGIEMREQLSLHLLKTEPWDLFTVVFMATDEVQHTFWHCMEAADGTPEAKYRSVILDIYKRLDQSIGAILEQSTQDAEGRETMVFVLSDHGAGRFRLMINLNRWLADMGYLHYRQDGGSYLGRLRATAFKRFARAYRRYLPAKTRKAIRTQLGFRRFDRAKEGFESALLTSNIDWDKTRAYAFGPGGNIFINLRDREPQGIVNPGEEYETLRQELSASFMTMKDPETSEPLIRQVYHREDLYHGPFLDAAPDLVIQWIDYANWGRGRYDSSGAVFEFQKQFDFSDQPLSGSHRPEGILIAQGPGIHAGREIEGAHLWDMAPTILSILDIPPTTDMDGRLLADLFIDDELEQLNKIVSERVTDVTDEQFRFNSEEEETIAKHLRSLGYL